MRIPVLFIGMILCFLLLILPVAALNEGKIAFDTSRNGNYEIYVMNKDGSGQRNLTGNPAFDSGPAWSPDGTKIAFRSDRDGNIEIYCMNADGTGQTRLTSSPAWDGNPAWSPDGTKIAFTSERGDPVNSNGSIYIMNSDGSGQTRLTSSLSYDASPAWSPDGSKISFDSNRDGNYEIYVMNRDGSGQTRLTSNAADDYTPAWSPDGSKIAFTSRRDGNSEIYVMNSNGSGQKNLVNNAAEDRGPEWSPDGARILFTSHRDGNYEVYVMNRDGSGQTRLTNNTAADSTPVWAPLVRVQVPDGGQTWKRGSTQTIRWNYTGSPGPSVMIELLKGTAVSRVINASTPAGSGGSGSCVWNVPYNQTLGNDYRIRIRSTSMGAYNDRSNANFTIGAGAPITVTIPNGGQNWKRNSTQTIRWKYTGNLGGKVKIELLKAGIFNRMISANTSVGSDGAGSYRWKIAPMQAPGNDYKIRITSTSNTALTDMSNADFAIIV